MKQKEKELIKKLIDYFIILLILFKVNELEIQKINLIKAEKFEEATKIRNIQIKISKGRISLDEIKTLKKELK